MVIVPNFARLLGRLWLSFYSKQPPGHDKAFCIPYEHGLLAKFYLDLVAFPESTDDICSFGPMPFLDALLFRQGFRLGLELRQCKVHQRLDRRLIEEVLGTDQS